MDNLILFIIIYTIINVISYHISLYFIFEKADIKGYYAFIPLVNYYKFMKMCRENPVWIFIPGFNIIVFIVCPVLVGYHFNQPYWVRFMGMFIPFLFYPYIAFSDNAVYIHRKISRLNLNSFHDIDKLEEKIKKDNELYENENIPFKKKKKLLKKIKLENEEKKLNYVDLLDIKLGQMDKSDVIVTDEELLNPVSPTIDPKETTEKQEELILDYDYDEVNNLNTNDIFDDISNKKDVGLSDVVKIEKETIDASKTEVVDNSNYKELQENKKSIASIAFNVDEKDIKDENKITVLDSKNESTSLKCPRCSSDLVGFHDYCPGCGYDISSLVSETK